MKTYRWNPIREMLAMERAMDRLLDRAAVSDFNQSLGLDLALDLLEKEDEFVVKASLPGINPNDLDITYENNALILRGEFRPEAEADKVVYHLRERSWGQFSRSLMLPGHIDADQIEASYQDGVLTLRLPKREEVRPRRISIGAQREQRQLETRQVHKN